jgi:DNA-binding transcriptional ArsR family regulator
MAATHPAPRTATAVRAARSVDRRQIAAAIPAAISAAANATISSPVRSPLITHTSMPVLQNMKTIARYLCPEIRLGRLAALDDRVAAMAQWTFLTNHAHVLLCVSKNPTIRLRDIAEDVGITERAAQRIVGELEEAGYLVRVREGRRNVYELNTAMPLRHPLDSAHRISELLSAFSSAKAPE